MSLNDAIDDVLVRLGHDGDCRGHFLDTADRPLDLVDDRCTCGLSTVVKRLRDVAIVPAHILADASLTRAATGDYPKPFAHVVVALTDRGAVFSADTRNPFHVGLAIEGVVAALAAILTAGGAPAEHAAEAAVLTTLRAARNCAPEGFVRDAVMGAGIAIADRADRRGA
jgi:hypothetical protein